jgi:hypothetical protein
MAKKRKKTDFGDLDERVKRTRAYIARKEEELRQRREREAAEPKRD